MFVKYLAKYYLLIVMVFNATLNNISAISLKYYGINIETSELTLPRYTEILLKVALNTINQTKLTRKL